MDPFDLFKEGNSGNKKREYSYSSSESRPAHISKPFVHDKAKYQLDSAAKEYCFRFGKSMDKLAELEEDDYRIIDEYCCNHIAFFVVWLIQNGFYNLIDHLKDEDMPEDMVSAISEAIEDVKSERMAGTKLVMQCGGLLERKDLKPEICGFVDWYYDPYYLDAYSLFVENELHKRPLGIGFSWKEYHQFQPVIDRAYQTYLKQSEGKE